MSTPSKQARLVLTTHPKQGASAFAQKLVLERLAACVNLAEVQSVYRWQGEIESACEVQLLLKTELQRIPALESFLLEQHPYDVPECVVLAPEHVEAKYAAWLGASL